MAPPVCQYLPAPLVYLYHALSPLLLSFLLCLSARLSCYLYGAFRLFPLLSVSFFNGALACNFICEILPAEEEERRQERVGSGVFGRHVLAFNKYFKCCVVFFLFSRPLRRGYF